MNNIHTKAPLGPAFDHGEYKPVAGCVDCANGVWYETDQDGVRWHKSWRRCPNKAVRIEAKGSGG